MTSVPSWDEEENTNHDEEDWYRARRIFILTSRKLSTRMRKKKLSKVMTSVPSWEKENMTEDDEKEWYSARWILK